MIQVIAHLLMRLSAGQRCEEEPSRLLGQREREVHVHVALESKTLRGTWGHEAPEQAKVHLLAPYETQTGLVLSQPAEGGGREAH